MSRWRRSVDELTALRRNQRDCEWAQEALSHVMSCFQQLAALLGSSADGAFLRNELEEIRALAYRICSGLSRRLLCLLSDSEPPTTGADDQQLSERLWVLFLSAVENLLSDLWKASDLIVRFPLTQPKDRHALVSTGCVDGPVGMAARVVLVQVPWVTLEEAPSPDLTSHITGLQTMLNEMQLRVPVAFWSVEATQPAWAEAHEDLAQPEESLEELMEVEVVSENKTMSACCRLHCVRASALAPTTPRTTGLLTLGLSHFTPFHNWSQPPPWRRSTLPSLVFFGCPSEEGAHKDESEKSSRTRRHQLLKSCTDALCGVMEPFFFSSSSPEYWPDQMMQSTEDLRRNLVDWCHQNHLLINTEKPRGWHITDAHPGCTSRK